MTGNQQMLDLINSRKQASTQNNNKYIIMVFGRKIREKVFEK